MSVLHELREQVLQQIRSDLLPFYLDHKCPCAFPRFRYLIGFYHGDFRAGPVGCHETELLIAECFQQERACYKPDRADWSASDPRTYTCPVCLSRYVEDYEDYSIIFYRTFMRVIDDRVTNIGADVVTPFPLVMGFYCFDQSDADICYDYFYLSSAEEFMKYMKETRRT